MENNVKMPKNWKYADMVMLSRPVSRHHAPMKREDRAAQFAPYAALTGLGVMFDEARIRHENEVEQQIQRESVE